VREGDDVTLVTAMKSVHDAVEAAAALEQDRISVEVIDLRTLLPFDLDALLASTQKTGRVVIVHEAPRTAGFGAELAALIAERAIFDLQGPVLRVTGFDVPYPYWTLEDAYVPSVERVVTAIRSLV
jgi:pyruvate/2-oxoglutarate/acetoin dehydrogenase E1 component